jgi:hypothetical protein
MRRFFHTMINTMKWNVAAWVKDIREDRDRSLFGTLGLVAASIAALVALMLSG